MSAFAEQPGRESFAIEPKTPEELWDAVDYLVRAGHADQAVPYLKKFLQTKPTDALLLSIRDRYGSGSVLRLDEHDETKPYAVPLFNLLTAASRRNAVRPDRLERFVDDLSKSRPEQDYAIEKLREAGSYAVPFFVTGLKRQGLTPEQRASIAYNMGRLDRDAVPALLAMLDGSDDNITADTAEALGYIGDPRDRVFDLSRRRSRDSRHRARRRQAVDRAPDRPRVRESSQDADPRLG